MAFARTLFLHIWNRLRTSYWFVPGLLVAAAAGLALGSLAIDSAWGSHPASGNSTTEIRSLPNQIALSVPLGNFVFCLIVLRGMNSTGVVPNFAAFTAFAATLINLATFIYFIHHISVSLQADHIVAKIHKELDASVERYFPDTRPDEKEGREAGAEKENWDETEEEEILQTPEAGYIQAVDIDGLVETCQSFEFTVAFSIAQGNL